MGSREIRTSSARSSRRRRFAPIEWIESIRFLDEEDPMAGPDVTYLSIAHGRHIGLIEVPHHDSEVVDPMDKVFCVVQSVRDAVPRLGAGFILLRGCTRTVKNWLFAALAPAASLRAGPGARPIAILMLPIGCAIHLSVGLNCGAPRAGRLRSGADVTVRCRARLDKAG